MSALGDALRRILEKAKKVRNKAKDIGDGGTPSEADKELVDGWLNDMEADLALIHDPNESPSLDPTDAGSVQPATIPTGRLETCEDALDLAEEADTEIGADPPDYDYIGDRTRTLESEYPGPIRSKFGIT
jgi:hypothetical protein